MSTWCTRCGGPVRNGSCENCAYAAAHRPVDHPAKVETVLISSSEVRNWVESMTPMTPDADPIDVLLDWLMPEPGDELEFLTTFVGHSGQIVTSRGTSLEVPSAVTSMLFGFLDLYASKARRPHSRFAELQLRRLRDEGMPIPEILHRLSVHRTRDGFRVRRLQ